MQVHTHLHMYTPQPPQLQPVHRGPNSLLLSGVLWGWGQQDTIQGATTPHAAQNVQHSAQNLQRQNPHVIPSAHPHTQHATLGQHACTTGSTRPAAAAAAAAAVLPEGAPADVALAQVFVADGLRDQALHLRRHAVAGLAAAAAVVVAAAAAVDDVVSAHEFVCHALHDSHGALIEHLTRITSCDR